MFERILMVCTANICRSPMAEAWMRHRLGETHREVRSAGLSAPAGAPAAPLAVALMAKRGVDLSAHRSQALRAEDVVNADLVLVMENWQKEGVERLSPAARGRTWLLGRWQELEIGDPYGGTPLAFESAFATIDKAVDAWLERIR